MILRDYEKKSQLQKLEDLWYIYLNQSLPYNLFQFLEHIRYQKYLLKDKGDLGAHLYDKHHQNFQHDHMFIQLEDYLNYMKQYILNNLNQYLRQN